MVEWAMQDFKPHAILKGHSAVAIVRFHREVIVTNRELARLIKVHRKVLESDDRPKKMGAIEAKDRAAETHFAWFSELLSGIPREKRSAAAIYMESLSALQKKK